VRSENRKVVIVDDSPTALSFASQTLSAAGYIVHATESFWEVSSLVYEHRPDLVLVDVQLGRTLRGTTAVSALRKRFPRVRFVLYSTLERRELSELANACGADGFLHKDGNAAALKEHVEALLAEPAPC